MKEGERERWSERGREREFEEGSKLQRIEFSWIIIKEI